MPMSARPTSAKPPMTFFAWALHFGQGMSWTTSFIGMRFSVRVPQLEQWYS